jgi:hypothetical protein
VATLRYLDTEIDQNLTNSVLFKNPYQFSNDSTFKAYGKFYDTASQTRPVEIKVDNTEMIREMRW